MKFGLIVSICLLISQTLLSQNIDVVNQNKAGIQLAANGLILPEYQRKVYRNLWLVGIAGAQDLTFLPRKEFTTDTDPSYSGGGYLGSGLVYHFFTFGKKKQKQKSTLVTAFGGYKFIGGKTNAVIIDEIYSRDLGSYIAEKDYGLVSHYRNEWTLGIEVNLKDKFDFQFIPICLENGKTWKNKEFSINTHPLHADRLSSNMQIGLHYRW